MFRGPEVEKLVEYAQTLANRGPEIHQGVRPVPRPTARNRGVGDPLELGGGYRRWVTGQDPAEHRPDLRIHPARHLELERQFHPAGQQTRQPDRQVQPVHQAACQAALHPILWYVSVLHVVAEVTSFSRGIATSSLGEICLLATLIARITTTFRREELLSINLSVTKEVGGKPRAGQE